MAQYRIPVEETFSWQRPVKDKDLTAPPVSPTKGDRYIVGGSATGDWAGHDKAIAWYTGLAWSFDTPAEGWQVYIEDENLNYTFNGTSWTAADLSGKADKVSGAVNGNLAGLDSNGNLTDSGKSASDFEDAGSVSTHESTYDHTKLHTQNTDTKLDEGGANEVTAAQAKEAYDKRGTYDSDLKCILMNL